MRGHDGDVLVLVNTGTFRPVKISVELPSGARVYDCWGNPLTVSGTVPLAIDRYPTYVVVPHGAPGGGVTSTDGRKHRPLRQN